VRSVKKLVIALVCVGLLVALIIPSIYSASKWPTYTLEFSEDSSSIDIYRPVLKLKFNPFGKYSGEHEGQLLDLTKRKDVISMQFFFFDQKGKKVVLKVEDGELEFGHVWLSQNFTIEFVGDPAEINSTKGKEKILWGPQNVNITVVCVQQE
jgi:hypothetical protein